MEHKRLFIGLPINSALVKSLLKDFNKLVLPKDGLRIVPAENYHLTIKFLGDMPIDKLMDIIVTAQTATAGFGSFEINIDKTKIFPTEANKPPRGLTIGLQPNPKLQALFDKVETVFWEAGLAHKETRRFTPHITVARIKKTATVADFKNFIDWPVNGSFTADNLQLQESILGKEGPEYINLNNFDL